MVVAINGKLTPEFKKKHKTLLEEGYCYRCICIMTSPLTIGKLCKKCQKIADEQYNAWIKRCEEIEKNDEKIIEQIEEERRTEH